MGPPPGYGHYAYYGEAPDMGEFGELEPVGYFAEGPGFDQAPELVGWGGYGYAEDPLGYYGYAEDPLGYGGYAEEPYGYYGYAEDPYGYAEDPYGYYAYAEDPYGYAEDPLAYAEDPYGYAEDPLAYAEDPYGYAEDPLAYAEDPYGYAEDPSLAYAEDPYGYAEDTYGAYVAERPLPNPACIVATNLSGFDETEYGEPVDLGAYVSPSTVNPSCSNFVPQPGSPPPVPETFRPLF
jgi:hypothetical protein